MINVFGIRKKIVRMDESRLRGIIRESVRRVLMSESNMHVLYHNTDMWCLLKMIEDNRMYFSENFAAQQRGDKPYYMSFTRYASDKEGYQLAWSHDVRLTIDNDRFQSIARGHTEPYERCSPGRENGYFKDKSAKECYRDTVRLLGKFHPNFDEDDIPDEYYENYDEFKPGDFAEAEESFNTDRPYVDNPLRFIISIDFWYPMDEYPVEYQERLLSLLEEHPEWKEKVHMK